MHTWIIGSGGLLGSALSRATPDAFRASQIDWSSTDASITGLSTNLQAFFTATKEQPWRIIWAAGQSITGTSRAAANHELHVYQQFINELKQQAPTSQGTFTLASSAGGVYAGSQHPPFTSSTEPVPISAYGELKHAQELVTETLSQAGIATTIARIANLYGPGQDLSKLQGVVSRLCLSATSRTEINIFVPLDTLRDYIYVDDAAQRLLYWSGIHHTQDQVNPTIRVIASGQPMSLGHVINTVQDVLHTRIPVSFGSNSAAQAQAPDIRLHPDQDDTIAAMPLMPFPAGVRRVFEDLLQRTQRSLSLR